MHMLHWFLIAAICSCGNNVFGAADGRDSRPGAAERLSRRDAAPEAPHASKKVPDTLYIHASMIGVSPNGFPHSEIFGSSLG